ncbi:hypothetical protein ACWEFJ_08345 [Actinosynnema sp. NPDC004786]
MVGPRWLNGRTAAPDLIDDMVAFALSIADFLRALRRVDAGAAARAAGSVGPRRVVEEVLADAP